jgi:hypothetical protein
MGRLQFRRAEFFAPVLAFNAVELFHYPRVLLIPPKSPRRHMDVSRPNRSCGRPVRFRRSVSTSALIIHWVGLPQPAIPAALDPYLTRYSAAAASTEPRTKRAATPPLRLAALFVRGSVLADWSTISIIGGERSADHGEICAALCPRLLRFNLPSGSARVTGSQSYSRYPAWRGAADTTCRFPSGLRRNCKA